MLQYKNILVPVDFSKTSRYALKNAIDLTRMNHGSLTLIHIVDYVPPPYVAAEIPTIYASEDLMIERAEKHLTDWAQELGLSDCKKIVKAGPAKKLIVRAVKENNVDLVIMGTHGETGIGRLLGSTANAVVQKVKCDVLVVHKDPSA